MSRVVFEVPGIPIPQGSMKGFARKGGGVILTSDNTRLEPWRAVVALEARRVWRGRPLIPRELGVTLVLEFRMPVPKSVPKRRRLEAVKKPDLDKLERAVLDALTAVVYVDDSQVVKVVKEKLLAYDRPPGLTSAVIWEEA